ncbi:MAG: hypothetical protein ACRESP_05200, partial [Pseudomonas sp.]
MKVVAPEVRGVCFISKKTRRGGWRNYTLSKLINKLVHFLVFKKIDASVALNAPSGFYDAHRIASTFSSRQ